MSTKAWYSVGLAACSFTAGVCAACAIFEWRKNRPGAYSNLGVMFTSLAAAAMMASLL